MLTRKLVTLIVFLCCSFHASGQNLPNQLEKVPLHEVVSKAYSSAVFKVDVGGSIGKVVITLDRDVDKGFFVNMNLNYEKLGVVPIPRRFINCIPHPWVEFSAFYFTDMGADAPSGSWFSSIEIPFGPVEPSDDDGEYIKIKRFPAIEFEVAGGKTINRVRIKKSDSEVKAVKDINGECPEELIKWAIGAAGK